MSAPRHQRDGQRHGAPARRRAAPAAVRFPAPHARPHRHACRLRARRVRRLHGAARRRQRARLPDVRRAGRRLPRSTPSRASARSDELNPLQEAFHEHHALQCGFCTPGMLMTATDLLQKYPLATDDEIREGLSGNLCRCTGYEHIVAAIRAVQGRESADEDALFSPAAGCACAGASMFPMPSAARRSSCRSRASCCAIRRATCCSTPAAIRRSRKTRRRAGAAWPRS